MPKNELVQALIQQRDELLRLCESLSQAQRDAPRTPEGWTIQDFVGHLSLWDQYTLNCLRDTLKNGRPTPMPADTADDDINGRAVAQRKNHSWQRVRAEFENTRNALIRRIEGMSENDLQFYVPDPWVGVNRVIALETIILEESLDHGAEHFQQFKTWQRLTGENISSDEMVNNSSLSETGRQ